MIVGASKKNYVKRKMYDIRVREVGHTKVLSLGRILPKGWKMVRITILDRTENSITLHVQKLYGEEDEHGTPAAEASEAGGEDA
jgi:hypothetical protein